MVPVAGGRGGGGFGYVLTHAGRSVSPIQRDAACPPQPSPSVATGRAAGRPVSETPGNIWGGKQSHPEHEEKQKPELCTVVLQLLILFEMVKVVYCPEQRPSQLRLSITETKHIHTGGAESFQLTSQHEEHTDQSQVVSGFNPGPSR